MNYKCYFCGGELSIYEGNNLRAVRYRLDCKNCFVINDDDNKIKRLYHVTIYEDRLLDSNLYLQDLKLDLNIYRGTENYLPQVALFIGNFFSINPIVIYTTFNEFEYSLSRLNQIVKVWMALS